MSSLEPKPYIPAPNDPHIVREIHPNSLALQRLNSERAAGRVSVQVQAAASYVPAKDNEDVIFNGETPDLGAKAATVSAVQDTQPIVSALPRAVDNTKEPWFPLQDDSYGFGQIYSDCNAQSIVRHNFASQVARMRGWDLQRNKDLSKYFNPTFIYAQVNWGRADWTNEGDLYPTLMKFGCIPESIAPYKTTGYAADTPNFGRWFPEAASWKEALRFRPLNYGYIDPGGSNPSQKHFDRIKQALANGYTLSFYLMSDSLYPDKKPSDPAVPYVPNHLKISNDPATTTDDIVASWSAYEQKACIRGKKQKTGGMHNVVLAGYNDDLWCDINGNGVVDAGEKGAFRLRNSSGQLHYSASDTGVAARARSFMR